MGIAYILYSADTLFKYKLVMEYLYWGSKHSQVFYTLSEFSHSTARIKLVASQSSPCFLINIGFLESKGERYVSILTKPSNTKSFIKNNLEQM